MYKYFRIGNYSYGIDFKLWKATGYNLEVYRSDCEWLWGPFVVRRWYVSDR